MLEYPEQSIRPETRQRRSGCFLLAGIAACLLALNCAEFYGFEAGWWSSSVMLILLFVGCATANVLLLPAGPVSFANIFLSLLYLFHMGYFLVVRLGLANRLSYMPPVYGEGARRSALVFCAALLSLELGYLFTAMNYCGANVRNEIVPQTEWTLAARYAGRVITALSFVSLMVFLAQAGGLTEVLHFSYLKLFAFFHLVDPRFAFTAMWFAPLGLLLWRAGLTNVVRPLTNERWLWRIAAALLLSPFLLIGARGPFFLFVVGCVYLWSNYERPYSLFKIASIAVVLALAASLIASFRNLDLRDRLRGVERWRVDFSAPLLEIGSTYRPYYGILEMLDSGQQEYLSGQSYWIAVKSLTPNIGLADSLQPSGYYRTSAWFNYRLSPRDDAAGVGIGCSIIAEQYANFGYFGVVGVFGAIGALIVALESRAILCGSSLARAVLAVLIIPLCWYIRDDIYGCIRMFVWPVAMLVIVRVCRLPLQRISQNSDRAPGEEA